MVTVMRIFCSVVMAMALVAVAVVAMWLGLSWQVAVAVGFIIAMSSTAIVLQLLNEKDQMGTAGGKAAFSVLLFQDIAVLPILALLPLLATIRPIVWRCSGLRSCWEGFRGRLFEADEYE